MFVLKVVFGKGREDRGHTAPSVWSYVEVPELWSVSDELGEDGILACAFGGSCAVAVELIRGLAVAESELSTTDGTVAYLCEH